MIRLTQRGNGRLFLVSPDKITSSGSYMHPTTGDDVHFVTYAEDGGDGVEIREDPMDVARLRAAWECRYDASELFGTLPIAVHMGVDESGAPIIQFQCCSITKRVQDEKAAAYAANMAALPPYARKDVSIWKRIRSWWAA